MCNGELALVLGVAGGDVGARREHGDPGRDRACGADLAPVAPANQSDHQAPDQHIDEAHGLFPSPPFRFRTLCARRLWSVNSSMKPGLASWENSPPDSPNEARERSYSAYGELRAT